MTEHGDDLLGLDDESHASWWSRWSPRIAWFLVLSYMALIWFVSSLSQVAVSLIQKVPLTDKGVHFIEFAVLGFLLAWSFSSLKRVRPLIVTLLTAWMGSTAWGAIDEVHQRFVPGRQSDVMDALADTMGGALGVALFFGFLFLFRRLRSV